MLENNLFFHNEFCSTKFETLTLNQINIALEILRTLEDSYIINITDAKKQWELLMNAKEKKILETYPLRIWQASNGTWKAHIPDVTKDRNRRIIQGKTKEHLENNILLDYQRTFDDKLVFANFFADWLINVKSNEVKPPTIQRIHDDYVKYIQGSKLDRMKITEIKRADVKNFLNKIINKYFLTRHCLSNVKSIFNGVFEYALDKEIISTTPMYSMKITNTNIKEPTPKTAETEIFNEEEFDVFIEYLYSHYMEHKPLLTLAILLNFQLALRVGELATLKKSDIHIKHRKIVIDRIERSYRPISLIDGKLVPEKTIHVIAEGDAKKNSNRVIDLSDEAIAIINRILELQKELSIDSEFLFPDENGKHTIRQRFNDCLYYYCRQLEIENKSSHKIRKTVLSSLFSKGFDFEEVMAIAGHRQKSTTLQYYLFSLKIAKGRQERLSKALASSHCNLVNPMSTQCS